jgi:hypothetical protein
MPLKILCQTIQNITWPARTYYVKEIWQDRSHSFFETILNHGLHRKEQDSSTLKPTFSTIARVIIYAVLAIRPLKSKFDEPSKFA